MIGVKNLSFIFLLLFHNLFFYYVVLLFPFHSFGETIKEKEIEELVINLWSQRVIINFIRLSLPLDTLLEINLHLFSASTLSILTVCLTLGVSFFIR